MLGQRLLVAFDSERPPQPATYDVAGHGKGQLDWFEPSHQNARVTTWLSALASALFAALLAGCGSKVVETGQLSADDSPAAEVVPCESDDAPSQ